jgi:hypothetical protein
MAVIDYAGTLLDVQDLSNRLPGQSLMEQALRNCKESRGRPSRSIRIGIEGERDIAHKLAQLGPDYKVIHSIPVPQHRKDIDHLVIGPTGTFLVSTKHYPDANLLVDNEYLIIHRKRYTDPLDADRDARHAAERLGFGSVVPIVAVVGSAGIRIKTGSRITVIPEYRLLTTITDRRKVLSAEQVAETYRCAIQPTTWGCNQQILTDPISISNQYETLVSNTPVSYIEEYMKPSRAHANSINSKSIQRWSRRRAYALILALTLGWAFGHRIYTRRWRDVAGSVVIVLAPGINEQFQPLTSLVLFIWWVVDVLRIITGSYRDGAGHNL